MKDKETNLEKDLAVRCSIEFDPGTTGNAVAFDQFCDTYRGKIVSLLDAFDNIEVDFYFKRNGSYVDMLDMDDLALYDYRLVSAIRFNNTLLQAKRIAKALEQFRLFYGFGIRTLRLYVDDEAVMINDNF